MILPYDANLARIEFSERTGKAVYTCEQWKPYGTQIFKEADRNHDGCVDAQKFEAIRKSHPMFKGTDLGHFHDNRAGRMGLSKFVDKPNPLFARYDKKGTCRITLDDITGHWRQPRGDSCPSTWR